MKKVLSFVVLFCFMALNSAYAEHNTLGGITTFAESDALGGIATANDAIHYSFAWSAERYEQSAELPEKADLHLTLARNEWEAFQLLVKTNAPDQAVTVEVTPFTNEKGDSFDALVYQVGYVTAEEGGVYPQTVNALEGAPVALTEGLTSSFLVEMQCPMEAAMGDYSATLTLKDTAGTLLLEKEVTATVYRFRMPNPTTPFVEPSAAKKGKLQALTGNASKSFKGYMGNSSDYFRIALSVFGEEWLNENFGNVVADLDKYMNDVEFFVAARPILATALGGDMSAYREEPAQLQFNEDGSFRIIVLSDIHQTCNGSMIDDVSAEYFRLTIEKVDPDLIVLLGDNVNTENLGLTGTAEPIRELMKYFEEWGVPVTIVFGNHESESSPLSMPRAMQLSVYQTFDCFIGTVGPDLPGAGNHHLPLLSSDGSKTAFNLWFFDSGAYHKDETISKYACVEPEQIAWYVEESNALKAANGDEPVPSLVFQHIIVPEIYEVLLEADNELGWALPEGNPGVMGERPAPPSYSNGQFAAFVSQGDVLATVHGHDHVNSFVVENQGIDIIMTPTCSTLNYYDEARGIRVFELNESDLWNYETYIIKPADVNSPW